MRLKFADFIYRAIIQNPEAMKWRSTVFLSTSIIWGCIAKSQLKSRRLGRRDFV
jgi:hypothetical protein